MNTSGYRDEKKGSMSKSHGNIVAAVLGALKKNQDWLLVFVIVTIVLGTIGLYSTFVLRLASVLFFGT
ncbi:MAG: hypothetical protein PVG22_06490 [Chromatiales bacterium]|jgi:hypothetical protein